VSVVVVDGAAVTPYGVTSDSGAVVLISVWVVAAAATAPVAVCRHVRREWGFDGVGQVDPDGVLVIVPWDSAPPVVYELFPAAFDDDDGAVYVGVRRP